MLDPPQAEHCLFGCHRSKLPRMGAVFTNAPNEPVVVAIYVMRIYFDAPADTAVMGDARQ